MEDSQKTEKIKSLYEILNSLSIGKAARARNSGKEASLVSYGLVKYSRDYGYDSAVINFSSYGTNVYDYKGVISINSHPVETFKIYIFDCSKVRHNPMEWYLGINGVKIIEMKIMDPELLPDILDHILLKNQ